MRIFLLYSMLVIMVYIMERLILYRARCDTHVYTNLVRLVYVQLW